MICISGTNLDAYTAYDSVKPVVTIGGSAVCDTANATSTATQLCCETGAAAVGASLAVAVHHSRHGFALSANTMPSFSYVAALELHSIDPPHGYAGATLTLLMDRIATSVTPVVTLGSEPCTVASVVDAANSRSTVTCTVTSTPPAPGAAAVRVQLPGTVAAAGDVLVSDSVAFAYVVAITGISPSAGSAGGGTLLTVSGSGFEHVI